MRQQKENEFKEKVLNQFLSGKPMFWKGRGLWPDPEGVF
jgi:hypothetical protein